MKTTNARKGALFGGLVLIQYATMSKQTREALLQRRDDLRNNRPQLKLALKKAAVLHLTFWILGSDQLGFLMNPKVKLGLGKLVARRLIRSVPDELHYAVALKIAEITSDEQRSHMEIWMTKEFGYGVDAWATFLTPEVWRCLEVPEKVLGVALEPQRMTGAGMELTIQNIYGNVVRMLMVAIMYLRGGDIDDKLNQLLGRS